MRILETFKMAFQALGGNRLRAGLTMLIISFGILALVGILTAIDGILFSMSDSFSSLGANSYEIQRKNPEIQTRSGGKIQKRAEPISYQQAMRFQDRMGENTNVSVALTGSTRATVKYGEESTNPTMRIKGINPNTLSLFNLDIEKGRSFTAHEWKYGVPVAIIGADLVNTLFKGEKNQAIGKKISADGNRFRVIGTIEKQGSGINPSSNADGTVYIPLLKAKQLYAGSRSSYEVTVGVPHSQELSESIGKAIGEMRVVRGLRSRDPNDFEIVKSDDLINTIRENTVKIRLGTIAIGVMTILGAAIGLMNIMLVSVTERTREIGLIKAIGARRRDILIQFLTEAIIICILGGIVGIVLGILAGNIVTLLLGSPFLIPWMWMGLAFLICFFVGLVAGLYPAIQAARLDPIEALRHE